MPISGIVTRISLPGDIMRGLGREPSRERTGTIVLQAGCLLLVWLSEGVEVFEIT
jgi:hypothetical protein